MHESTCFWGWLIAEVAAHQGRENIASRPLKIIAICIILCGHFQ
jgi:hypothetical protein